jgi:hypothetical protein
MEGVFDGRPIRAPVVAKLEHDSRQVAQMVEVRAVMGHAVHAEHRLHVFTGAPRAANERLGEDPRGVGEVMSARSRSHPQPVERLDVGSRHRGA